MVFLHGMTAENTKDSSSKANFKDTVNFTNPMAHQSIKAIGLTTCLQEVESDS